MCLTAQKKYKEYTLSNCGWGWPSSLWVRLSPQRSRSSNPGLHLKAKQVERTFLPSACRKGGPEGREARRTLTCTAPPRGWACWVCRYVCTQLRRLESARPSSSCRQKRRRTARSASGTEKTARRPRDWRQAHRQYRTGASPANTPHTPPTRASSRAARAHATLCTPSAPAPCSACPLSLPERGPDHRRFSPGCIDRQGRSGSGQRTARRRAGQYARWVTQGAAAGRGIPSRDRLVIGDMSRQSGAGSPAAGSPRARRQLRDRVSFFEQLSSPVGQARPRSASSEDLLDSRASNSSYEESFERLLEEGEYDGAKLLKFERITVKKSVRELTVSSFRCSLALSPALRLGLCSAAVFPVIFAVASSEIA